jgi:hypothetical protein
VTQGNHQCPGFDYSETFVPTFRQLSMCLIMALAAEGNLHMCSVDITSGVARTVQGSEQTSKRTRNSARVQCEQLCIRCSN